MSSVYDASGPIGQCPGIARRRYLAFYHDRRRLIFEVQPGDSGMAGPEVRFIDGQRPAYQRFGLREPVGGLEQCRQVVKADGDYGMAGPEA
jgi:hypothetical protein